MKRKWPIIALTSVLVITSGGALALGDYVYRSGTEVPCGVNEDDVGHSPEVFYTPTEGNGSFPGDNWLNETPNIPSESLGMFGVSAGAIATSLVPAKTDYWATPVISFCRNQIFRFNR